MTQAFFPPGRALRIFVETESPLALREATDHSRSDDGSQGERLRSPLPCFWMRYFTWRRRIC
jgi:hypothetical protein